MTTAANALTADPGAPIRTEACQLIRTELLEECLRRLDTAERLLRLDGRTGAALLTRDTAERLRCHLMRRTD